MRKMVEAGLNIVRLNLSHGSTEGMGTIIENVKKIRKELNVPLPIMVDTRGPEIRVKTFVNGFANIKKRSNFHFYRQKYSRGRESSFFECAGCYQFLKSGR